MEIAIFAMEVAPGQGGQIHTDNNICLNFLIQKICVHLRPKWDFHSINLELKLYGGKRTCSVFTVLIRIPAARCKGGIVYPIMSGEN